MYEWDAAGVRGVRMNLVSHASGLTNDEIKRRVMRDADLVHPWRWILQLYAPMSTVDILDEIIPSLGSLPPLTGHPINLSPLVLRVPTVCDHFAFPASPTSPSSSPTGFNALLRTLLEPAPQFFLKISAPYRIAVPLAEIRPILETYFRTAPERLVFASDWPDTNHDDYDPKGWPETVARWCIEIGGEEAAVKLFRSNAETLWRGRGKTSYVKSTPDVYDA